MGLFLIILLGLFVGWLVAAVLELDEGILASMALGVAGALAGGVLLQLTGKDPASMLSLNWGGLLCATVGAFIAASATEVVMRTRRHSVD
jgi:uncharacterized membrane protein YeaQ/YmgE (transglycosylase-associated protein family)